MAALAFLDAVDVMVAPVERERFERLRDQVCTAHDGQGLPEGVAIRQPAPRVFLGDALHLTLVKP